MPQASHQPPREDDSLPSAGDAEAKAEPGVALVVGATGLIGKCLVDELLEARQYAEVRVLSRRPLERRHERLVVHVVDFERPDELERALPVSHVFCCLGTTMKKAGSEAAFRHVDLELPLELSRRALARGATGLFVVTALGADPGSRLFYYRTKGELEVQLKELGYPTLAMFRPSFLGGERDEQRGAEQLFIQGVKSLAPLLRGSLRRYRVVPATDVAKAMLVVGRTALGSRDPLGTAIYESDAIVELAAQPAQRKVGQP